MLVSGYGDGWLFVGIESCVCVLEEATRRIILILGCLCPAKGPWLGAVNIAICDRCQSVLPAIDAVSVYVSLCRTADIPRPSEVRSSLVARFSIWGAIGALCSETTTVLAELRDPLYQQRIT